MTPGISVLMAARDAEKTVGRALRSLAAQTFAEWECVVVDDGSRDGTAALVRAFGDGRVRLVAQEPSGLTVALKRAVGEAVAPVLARLDADDEAAPRRLERQVRALTEGRDIAAVGAGIRLVSPEGRALGERLYPAGHEALAAELDALLTPIPHSTLMMTRAAYDAAGGYRPDFPKAQDYDLLRRLARVGRLASVPEPLASVRLSAGSMTEQRGDGEQFEYCVMAFACDRVRALTGADPLDGGDRDRFRADFSGWYRASRYPGMFRSRLERRAARVGWGSGRPAAAVAALGRATLLDPAWAVRRAIGGDLAAEVRAWAAAWARRTR
ncbi:MAG: glycosyltransferase family 2 protein [Elusimicrobia bacterium]|nr:glycosyltransferase family 2 protein [Elusimicrobiota bacterium]